uniref:Flagellar basal-body M-ring protein/flagellar hook-basal body protein FliF n=1 Tax=Eubacterium cellulosolvens (strain ATCC 43171 / JCM 9499 / 6) TaxID=633697 RepID=I5ARW9_EUBC6
MKILNKLKETWQQLSAMARRLLIIVLVGAVAFVAIGIVLLNQKKTTEYTTLFTGLNQEESREIVSMIQEEGKQYLYDAGSGTIQVPVEQADKLRAEILSKGYPQSGFTYSMYVGNSGIMATESDKEQYTLYDLQDRLGATIRLFDGVRDAKVTIAQADDDGYVLDEDGDTKSNSDDDVNASASVVVTMKRGSELTEKNADAIRNLVARSVRGINFTNVSVFDAATMQEIGGNADDESANSEAVNELTKQVENNIAANVKKVLAKLYHMENVEVAVRGKLDTSTLLSENTQYTVPVQADSTDKEGLLDHEEDASAYTGPGAATAAGVAGTDANADTPRYTTENGANGDEYSSFDTSTSRQWLYNTLKEQVQRNPGTLQDCTVAVVIDTEDTSVDENDLINLVADAAGISREDAPEKITVVRSAIPKATATPTPGPEDNSEAEQQRQQMIIIAAAVGAFLFLLLIILIIRGKKKKKKQRELEAQLAAEQEAAELAAAEAEAAAAAQSEKELSEEESASNEHVARGQELKDNIGDFVEENPQVAAKLIQSWLREGDEKSGRKQRRR